MVHYRHAQGGMPRRDTSAQSTPCCARRDTSAQSTPVYPRREDTTLRRVSSYTREDTTLRRVSSCRPDTRFTVCLPAVLTPVSLLVDVRDTTRSRPWAVGRCPRGHLELLSRFTVGQFLDMHENEQKVKNRR